MAVHLNPYDELIQEKIKYGLARKIPCSPQESQIYIQAIRSGQPLPTGVYKDPYAPEFFRIAEIDLTETQRKEFFALQQIKQLTTIKNCMVFFTVLTVIALIVSIVIETS